MKIEALDNEVKLHAAAHDTSGFSPNELYTPVGQINELKRQYAADSGNVQLAGSLAAGYLKFANAAAAQKHIHRALKIDPGNVNAQALLQQVRSIR